MPALCTRGRLSLSSKVVHYINMPGKIVQNKSSECLHLQKVQKHKNPMEKISKHFCLEIVLYFLFLFDSLCIWRSENSSVIKASDVAILMKGHKAFFPQPQLLLGSLFLSPS